MFAHGAQTIKSGISVKSAFTGSHILSKQVLCVMPFFMQHPRTSVKGLNDC